MNVMSIAPRVSTQADTANAPCMSSFFTDQMMPNNRLKEHMTKKQQ
jgi:hypothetical protein